MSVESNEGQNHAAAPANPSLLSSIQIGDLSLPNRIVMSPMTRARSADSVPSDIEAQYYSQRASAGLIITGGIYISRMAVGGINVPGIFTDVQLESWRRITTAVHAAGGRILAQLSHSGSG